MNTKTLYIYTFKSSVKVKLLLKIRNEIEHFYFWGHVGVRRTHLSRGLLVVSVFTDFPLILFLARNYSVLYKQKIKPEKNVTKFIEEKNQNK